MKTWNIHVVRIPINEQCWLGTNGTPSGDHLPESVKDYVNLLVANGINVILDLHWTYGSYSGGGNGNCTDVNATCQKPMPDAQYAPQFWTSVATTFKGNNAVIFDLFNEPWPDDARRLRQHDQRWTVLARRRHLRRHHLPGRRHAEPGRRGTRHRRDQRHHARRPGVVQRPDAVADVQADRPDRQPGGVLARRTTSTPAPTTSCWDSQVAPLAAQVPVVAGEIGQNAARTTSSTR